MVFIRKLWDYSIKHPSLINIFNHDSSLGINQSGLIRKSKIK